MVYFIRSGSLFGYPELVRELGGDPLSLINTLQLDPRLQNDFEYLLPTAKLISPVLTVSAP